MQRPLRRLTSLLAATTTLWLAGTGHAQIRLEEDARAHVEWPDRGPEGLRARDFLAGDLDGDGADDLVVIGHSDVDVMINAGNGTLAHRATVFVAQGRLATGTLFDADGDGDLDLLALAGDPLGYSSGGIPGVAFNDGAGNLARNFAKTVPNMQLQGLLVLAEDLDGDGDLDLTMIQNRGFQTVPDTIVVWENDGSGSFVDATAARAPSVGTCEAALAGDLDGDGHQDLLLSIGAPTGPMLLMYDGTAYVDRSSLLPGYPLALGDVDGDGDTDLVMSTGFELNDGTGANWTNVPHGALLAGNEVGFVGDLDLDGRGDVATIDVQRAVHVYLQTAPSTLVDATGTWVEPHVDREQASIFPGLYVSIARLLAHDFDADGDPDLVIGGAEARYSSFTVGVPPKLLVNDGGRRLVDGSRTRGFDPRTHRSTGGIAVGDVDGDGDVDAVLSDWWAYGVPSLYHNDGFGNFVLDPASFATRAFSLALVDLDGDGDLDLVEGQGIYFTGTGVAAASGQDRVRLNDGLGNFTDVTAANMPAFVGLTSDLAIGDVDGDGDQDIVTTCAGREAQTLRVLINDGNAGFTLGFAALPAKEAWSVELADFDGDGDLDIAVTETGSMYYFTNDGAGGFVDETAARVPSPSSYGGFTVALTSADVDGDGDLDLNHPFATLLNDGSGVFSFSPPALPCMPFYGKVHFADFDEDGELESASGSSGLCVAGALPSYNGGVNVVFDAIAPADVDGDGDVDLLVPSRVNEIGTHVHDHASRLGLLFNLRRQLRAPLLPRLGRDFPVVMYGTDGSGTSHGIAFFGYATTRTVIPGIGSLVLDPASAVPVSGVLAVAGSDGATVPVAIPTAPVLQGMAFAAQAAVWHGGDLGTVRLTNAVRGEIIR